MKSLTSYYTEQPQYLSRLATDTYFLYGPSILQYSGISDRMARLIEEVQLKDAALWRLFVRQFKGTPDDADLGWRCEYWGKMMRGGCMTYLYTRDAALYAVLRETVEDLLKTQDERGRISSYSVSAEFDGWDLWGRKYVLLGLLHFHEICTDASLREQVLAACCRHADDIVRHIGNGEGQKNITDTSRHWGGINSSSILEPFVRLYLATGVQRYLEFASYIIDNGGSKNGNIFEYAYRGEKYPFEYPDYKAYELMSCFEGLIEYYRVTREEKWLVAAKNFVSMLRVSDVTIIGCSGCTDELLDHSAVRQTYTKYDGIMQETCVAVTYMKLCMQMLLLTGDASFADEIERSAFNVLYGAVNTENSKNNGGLPFDSYSPLRANIRGREIGGFKYMENKTAYYGCCACIGAAGTALVPLSNILLSKEGIAVNFYLPGSAQVVTPSGNALTLETETDYPADGRVKLQVHISDTEQLDVALRIPYYSKKTVVLVNGSAVPGAEGGRYLQLLRNWSDGDVIEIEFELPVMVHHGAVIADDPESETYIALQKGALVLARDARLGEDVGSVVSLKTDADGAICFKEGARPSFDVQCAWDMETEGGKLVHLIDYASAGKTWDAASRMECWMKGR